MQVTTLDLIVNSVRLLRLPILTFITAKASCHSQINCLSSRLVFFKTVPVGVPVTCSRKFNFLLLHLLNDKGLWGFPGQMVDGLLQKQDNLQLFGRDKMSLFVLFTVIFIVSLVHDVATCRPLQLLSFLQCRHPLSLLSEGRGRLSTLGREVGR